MIDAILKLLAYIQILMVRYDYSPSLHTITHKLSLPFNTMTDVAYFDKTT